MKLLEREIKEKMLKIDDPEATIEERPFSEEPVLGGNLVKGGATDAEQANSACEIDTGFVLQEFSSV